MAATPRVPARSASCAGIRGASRSTRTRCRTATTGAPGGCTHGQPDEPDGRRTRRQVSGKSRRRTAELGRVPDGAPFTLTATILGASVSPNPDMITSATIGVPVARSYTMTNLFGAFTGRAVGTALGSAFRARPTIANLAQQTTRSTVPAGATSLRATIGNPADPAADLDLFVLRCPTGPRAGRAERRRRLRGVGHDREPGRGDVDGPRRRLRDSRGDDGVRLHRRLPEDAARSGRSRSPTRTRCGRPAGSSWTVTGTVTANAGTGCRPRPLRQRRSSD